MRRLRSRIDERSGGARPATAAGSPAADQVVKKNCCGRAGPGFGHDQAVRHLLRHVLAGCSCTMPKALTREADADRLEVLGRDVEDLLHDLAALRQIGGRARVVEQLHALLLAFRRLLPVLAARTRTTASTGSRSASPADAGRRSRADRASDRGRPGPARPAASWSLLSPRV